MLNLKEFNSLYQLLDYFKTEVDCHQYVASKRWAGLMSCPYDRCNGEKVYVFKDGIRYKCRTCQRIYNAKTRTIFEYSKLPLKIWLIAMYHVMCDKGISSVQFAKNYNITQKSAWALFQKIRKVLTHYKQDDLLSGIVEIDEAYIGGKNKNRHHDKKTKFVKDNVDRQFQDKTTVLGMMQRGSGHIKLAIVNNRKKDTLTYVINNNIKKGSHLMTDEWQGYNDLTLDFKRTIVNHNAKQYVNGECYTNTLEGFWTQLKRLIAGRHHWVSKHHLNKYLHESTFKYNNKEKTVSSRFAWFLQACVGVVTRIKALMKPRLN